MPRKFSFDLAALVVNKKTTRKDAGSLVDSPPQTPKSLRPPLPEDVEAALRAVCAQVFNECNASQLPDVDHDMITQFWQLDNGALNNVNPQRSDSLVPPTDLAPELARPVQVAIKPRVPLEPPAPLVASVPKTVHRQKASGQPRGDSMDTTTSGTYSDDTDEPLNASTAMTSAVITPAKASKRTSGHASLREERAHRPSALQSRQHSDYSVATNPLRQHPPTEYALRTGGSTVTGIKTSTHRENDVADPSRRRNPSRTARQRAGTNDTQVTEDERNGRTTFRSRAASRARSLSRGVRDFIRPGHRRELTDQPQQRQLHSASSALHDTSRPDTSSGMRRPSMDFFRRGRRASREHIRGLGSVDNSSRTDLSDSDANSMKDRSNRNGGKRRRDDLIPQKPCIDLNRELPPLPSLGLWQDSEDVPPSAHIPKPISKQESVSSHIADQYLAPAAPLNLRPKSIISHQYHEIETPAELDSTYQTPANISAGLSPAPSPMPTTPTSPLPQMSATAGPGDFDMYTSAYVPSPLSGSSLKDLDIESRQQPENVRLSGLLLDDDAYADGRESPVIVDARRLSGISVPETRPQLVHNRRPSSHSSRREPVSRNGSAEEVPQLPTPIPMAHHAQAELTEVSVSKQPLQPEQSVRDRTDMSPRETGAAHDDSLALYSEFQAPQNDSKVDIHDRLREGRHYSRPSVNEMLDTTRIEPVTTAITPATPNAMIVLKKMAKKHWWKSGKSEKPGVSLDDFGGTQGSSRTFRNDVVDQSSSVGVAAPVVRSS